MSRSLWIGAVALVLLGRPAAGCQDQPEAAQPESGKVEVQAVGPIRVEVQAEVKAAPGQPVETSRKIWINGQPVEVQGGTVAVTSGTLELGGKIKLSDYWLGIAVGQPEQSVRSKLKIPEDQGLIVNNVVADSPAAKAGIQEGDVLLKAGDKPLKKVQELIDVVDQTKDKDLRIELLRDGQQQTLTVTPAKRPPQQSLSVVLGENPDWEKILKWFEHFQAGAEGAGQPPLQFRVLQPGAIVPPGVLLQHPLPDDMTVTISKTGKKAAQITVKQGEKNWDVTEQQLDKLPANVRQHIERLLGRMPFSIKLFESGEVPQPPPLQLRERVVPAQPESRLEKRFEEMNRRIERLNQMIDELRQKGKEDQPRQKQAPAEKDETKEGPKTL
jgi:hypothetical protein